MEILDLDLTSIARHLAKGNVSSLELTEQCLGRLESLGRKINCVVNLAHDSAIAAAEHADRKRATGQSLGPLHGIPFAHKDNLAIKGRIASAGSRILREAKCEYSATVMTRLERAGAINVGSLHMSEFAMSPTGYNKHLGYCHNPWREGHVTGGSSSGSAAAVAASLVCASLGTDTGGSIRLPASYCGVFGLKPTYGLVSRYGVFPLAQSLDCVGPLARSPRDCAVILQVIAGPDESDTTTAHAPKLDYINGLDDGIQGLSVVVLTSSEKLTSEAVRKRIEETVSCFRALGCQIRHQDYDLESINALNRLILNVEAAAVHKRWLKDRSAEYSDHVHERLRKGLTVLAFEYVDALAARGRLTKEFCELVFNKARLLLLPTAPYVAPRFSADVDGGLQRVSTKMDDIVRFTRLANYFGLPAISIPAGEDDDGLPIGFQLIGRHFDDVTVLAAAQAYSKLSTWKRPVGLLRKQMRH